jgi:putative transposase
MPVNKKQNTTPPLAEEAAQKTEAAPVMFSPETFHEHLRGEIRQATRLVMEEIMQEELTQFVGAKWGEITPNRRG